jgi:hypothetical protein
MVRRTVGVCLLVCGFGLLPASALAADLPPGPAPDFAGETAPPPSGWTFAVAPYLFAASLSGNVAQFGTPTIHVDADFGDILDNLKFGAMVTSEARNGPFGLFTDLMYVKIGEDVKAPLGATVNLTSSTFTGTAMGEYRVFDSAAGSVDAMAGIRIWSLTSDLDFSGGPLGGQSFSDDATWVDGMVGVKGRLNLGGKFFASSWAMAGAGGAKIDWDLLAGLGYDFNKSFSLVGGYRALGVDYSHDGFVFDVVQQGPYLGGMFRF